MARPRLLIEGVASLAEAWLAVEAGADIVGLEAPAGAGMASEAELAAIALALPPGVTAALASHALTAGTIAQQIDAAAAGVVILRRPLDASEYPGLKRIIRGRKIIQELQPGAIKGGVAEIAAEFADALLVADGSNTVPRDVGKPLFVRHAVVAGSRARSFGIAVALPRDAAGRVDERTLAKRLSLAGLA